MSYIAREHEDAAWIAEQAGRILRSLREEARRNERPREGLGAAGDRASNSFILQALAERYPEDAVLSEETARHPLRRENSRLWIVDPLDGTREFTEEGRTDWAVHVALAIEGLPLVGAVSLPARRLTFSTGAPPRLSAAPARGLRLAVSRTRPPRGIAEMAQYLGAELVPMGSAGAKTMAVVLGEVDLYVHSGGQFEWDSAAPVAVARAAGLHASRISGAELLYNQENPCLPDLLVCRPQLVSAALTAIRQFL